MDIDEVDGEVPLALSGVQEPVVVKDVEKSQVDSGMDEESNIGSLEVGENSDDEDEVIIKKPKKSFQRILDDDSDVSQDVPSQTVTSSTSKPEGMTAEEALEAVMKDSSDEGSSAQEDASPKSKRKKKLKRPVSDDSSSEDENTSLMDALNHKQKKADNSDIEGKVSTQADSSSDEEGSNKSKLRPDNLFDKDNSDSESEGCKSSGSEVEKSDHEDEGFDDSQIDPKLLAKLRKGASKKPKTRTKREEKVALHSETQRMVRESRVSIPYHQPAPKSLNDFLARASRKQEEYKVLKGARNSTKVRVLQEVLEKTRIQARNKSQEELDKYSDSDEDWNPEEDDDKKLKDRIDDRLNKPENSENVPSNSEKSATMALESGDSESGANVVTQGGEVTENIETNANVVSLEGEGIVKDDKEKREGTDSIENDIDDNDSLPELVIATDDKLEEVTCESEEKDKEVRKDDAINEENMVTEGDDASNELTENNDAGDLLFDWEKDEDSQNGGDSKTVDKTNECIATTLDKNDESTRDSVYDPSEENKENIDPTAGQNSNDSDQVVVTPEKSADDLAEQKASRRHSSGKKRKKIAALAGIDLGQVKPCLSGNVDTFISLEDGEDAPVHPGVKNLMDRVTKHAKKTDKKKKKDTDISIISKDTTGLDQQELHLKTFTYHAQEEEVNPLLKLETPGAKLLALKEQLQEKMKRRREQARQKRQEAYDLDNEGGAFESEGGALNEALDEEEMSDRSDTDDEEGDDDDDIDDEEMYGEGEEEMEGDKEANPFVDEEADEEDEGDDDDDDDNSDDDDEMNLKLDVSDEGSDNEDEASQDKKSSREATKDRESETESSVATFKEPKEPTVPEKPFSMFGSKGRENSIEQSQIQSGQRPGASIPMPIEDSQDLCGSMLPQISHTQTDEQSQQSQDFNFLLEDSQSNILDADGYIKTKSTGKKKKPQVTSFSAENFQATQGNVDELFGLCSGRFVGESDGSEKTSRKSLFDEGSSSSQSNTQGNIDELKAFCSGVFADSTQRDMKSKKRKATDVESDEESIGVYSDNEDKLDNKNNDADDDDDNDDDNVDDEGGDTDHLDSEAEDDEERPAKFTGFKDKASKGKILREFVEAEAELSGSEFDSDENEDLAEEEDIMELEEGDRDVAHMDKDKLRDEVGRVHFKQMIDDDKRELLRFQEMYLPDGDLHAEGGGRMRRFRWTNVDDDTQQDMFHDDAGSDEEPEHVDTDDFQWRKERFEREKFLNQQEMEQKDDGDNSQFLKLGKVFLKKQVSVESNPKEEKSQSQANAGDTPGFPGSFYKLPQQKRGSFLARSKEALAKIAEMTKPVVNPSAGAKSSGKFTFSSLSPEKGESTEVPEIKEKKRKAHVPSKKSIQKAVDKPPAKKPKLDTKSSFTGNSIFNHF